MLGLVLSTLLAAKAPAVGLSVSVSVKVTAKREQDALAQLSQGLAEAGLPTIRLDTKQCKGDEACLLQAAKDNNLDGAIFATLAPSGRDAAVDLDSKRMSDGASIAQLTFKVGAVLDDARRQRLKAFAGQVLANLPVVEEPPPKKVVEQDIPKVEKPPELTPSEPPPSEPPIVVEQDEEPSRVLPYTLTGAAVLAGAGAGMFAYLGNQKQTEAFQNNNGISPHTRGEAQGLIDQANTNYSVAAGMGVAAVALLTGAIISFATAD